MRKPARLNQWLRKDDVMLGIRCTRWLWRHCTGYRLLLAFLLALDVVVPLLQVWTAFLSKDLIDTAVSGEMKKLLMIGMVFGAGTLLVALVESLRSYVSKSTIARYTNGLREEIYERVIRADWLQASRYHTGDLLTRFTDDIDAVGNGLLAHIPEMAALLVQMVVAFTALALFEPGLAVAALLMVPAAALFSRIVGRRIGRWLNRLQTLESKLRGLIQETLANLATVKAFRMETASRDKLHAIQLSRLELVIRSQKFSAASGLILSVSSWGGFLLTLLWGASRLAIGKTTFGSILAFVQLVEQVQGPFMSLGGMIPGVAGTLVSAKRVMDLEDLAAEDSEGTDSDNTETISAICFRQVSYRYGNESKGNRTKENDTAGRVSMEDEADESGAGFILKNADIRFERGAVTAVTGPSGIGKTTMLRILLALLRTDSGIAGWEDAKGIIHRLRPSSRKLFAYVPQGNSLMSGTIRENIRCGRPDASDADVVQAAWDADIGTFIESLDGKYETLVGENGLGISEGQAQRIAIARALVMKAPVLVLDEATSALDMEAEARVLSGIMRREPNLICILVTHRLTALPYCDKVFRLDKGQFALHGG